MRWTITTRNGLGEVMSRGVRKRYDAAYRLAEAQAYNLIRCAAQLDRPQGHKFRKLVLTAMMDERERFDAEIGSFSIHIEMERK